MSMLKKMWVADNGDGTYRNPILYTDYSDPDAVRVGEDYFMIASSFCNTPAIPVLHSRDLVNWKVISYALDRIPFPDYDTPQHGRGVWAPAIRYHDSQFWIFFPMPDEGIFCCTSKDPFKGWSEPFCVRSVVGWIDPCPFWDEDGKAYMVSAFARSRIGFKSILHMSPIKPDCTDVLGDGKHIFDGNETVFETIEGPKLYKRNGYYYIFAPAGGVKTGFQAVLRSKNIYGPYEEKIVLHQGDTEINGPHQGAWVDTPGGEHWFLHFQDVGNAGRIVHLQPMKWVDDWPVIGIKEDKNGCGEPVMVYKKPDGKAVVQADAPEDSDDFTGDSLGLQWQWNANYQDTWYRLDKEKKQLVLTAVSKDSNTQFCDVRNLLLQKWPAPDFFVTARMQMHQLTEGDYAGMVSLGGVYTCFGIKLEQGKKLLCQNMGEWTRQNEVQKILIEINAEEIYLRMKVEGAKEVSFSYSLDGVSFMEAGETSCPTPGRWVGVKAGLFCVHEGEGNGREAAFDSFIYSDL